MYPKVANKILRKMSTKRQKCEHKKIFWMENLKTVAQPEESLTFNSMNSKNHKHGFAFQMIAWVFVF